MINQYVKDNQGTVYIGIKNVDNRFCYYISAIQRLHSSATLSQALQSFNGGASSNSDKYSKYRIILKPLEIYSRINVDPKYKINNIQEIYNELETELITTTNNLSDKLQHGGNPDHVLIALFLPAIYNVFGLDVVKKVIHELYINPNRLNFLLYDNSRIHDFELTNDTSLNNELYNGFGELQKALKNEPLNNSNSKFDFRISTMSIMFKDMYGQQSKYNGHAINLVKGVNDEGVADLYIIDDSVGISAFKIYLDRHENRIGYWEVKDATDELLQELTKNDKIDIDKRLHRDVINIKNSNNLSGGYSDSDSDSEDESIKRYKEEIVNECSWCPFVSVKDTKEGKYNQEIYGVIGGSLSGSEKISRNADSDDKCDKCDKCEDKKHEDHEDHEDHKDHEDHEDKFKGGADEIKDKTPLKIKLYNEFQKPMNKYLSYTIGILIIVIIITLIIRRRNIQKTKKKIETYITKIKDTRKKNIELATQIVKTRQQIEKPKKEVELILKAGQKQKYEMPSSRQKTDFFQPKMPFHQLPIGRFNGFHFEN